VYGLKSITITVAAVVLLAATASPCAAQTRFQERRQARIEARRQGQLQGNHAGQWLRRYKDLPPDQQQKALENDSQFRSLPPFRQQILRERLQRFSSLPKAQQDRILQRMETWEHLTPAQKIQARQLYSQLKELPPDRRQKVRTAIRDLSVMPPGQRQQVIESDRLRASFLPRSAACSIARRNSPSPHPRRGRTNPPPKSERLTWGQPPSAVLAERSSAAVFNPSFRIFETHEKPCRAGARPDSRGRLSPRGSWSTTLRLPPRRSRSFQTPPPPAAALPARWRRYFPALPHLRIPPDESSAPAARGRRTG